MFYNGNVVQERATVITRIAPTFLRFGSFEIIKSVDPTTNRSGPSPNNLDLLGKLINHTATFFPADVVPHTGTVADKAEAIFVQAVRRTAELVAQWQCVGFCHGVLNTDNMSILGVRG